MGSAYVAGQRGKNEQVPGQWEAGGGPGGREQLQLGLGRDAANLIRCAPEATSGRRADEFVGAGEDCPRGGDARVWRAGGREAGPWISGGR